MMMMEMSKINGDVPWMERLNHLTRGHLPTTTIGLGRDIRVQLAARVLKRWKVGGLIQANDEESSSGQNEN